MTNKMMTALNTRSQEKMEAVGASVEDWINLAVSLPGKTDQLHAFPGKSTQAVALIQIFLVDSERLTNDQFMALLKEARSR